MTLCVWEPIGKEVPKKWVNSKARPRSWWADLRTFWTNRLGGAGRRWWRRRQWVRLRVAHGVGAEPRPGAGAAASENWRPE